MHPQALIPATTALATLAADGRERGILAGANVVMPNLSPQEVRGKYELYNKCFPHGEDPFGTLPTLKGYTAIPARGDAVLPTRGGSPGDE